MTSGYFLISDILGFPKIVASSTEEDASARVQSWVELAERAGADAGITAMQLISDTLFASAPDTSEGLGELVRYSKMLSERGLECSLPIRGGVSHGQYEWGSLTYGKAVLSAHRIESSLEWVGIACEPELPHVADHWGFDSLVCYPAQCACAPLWLGVYQDTGRRAGCCVAEA